MADINTTSDAFQRFLGEATDSLAQLQQQIEKFFASVQQGAKDTSAAFNSITSAARSAAASSSAPGGQKTEQAASQPVSDATNKDKEAGSQKVSDAELYAAKEAALKQVAADQVAGQLKNLEEEQKAAQTRYNATQTATSNAPGAGLNGAAQPAASGASGAGQTGTQEDFMRRAEAAREYSVVLGDVLTNLEDLRDAADKAGNKDQVDEIDHKMENVSATLGKLDTQMQQGDPFGRIGVSMQNFLAGMGDVAGQASQALQGIVNTGINGVSNGIMGMINHTKNAGQAFQAMGTQMIQILIQMALKLMVANVLMAILDALTGGTAGPAMGGMLSGLIGVGRKDGGIIRAAGGFVSGPGGPRDDRVPALLSNGEAVIPAGIVAQNPGFIQSMIAGAVDLNNMASQIPSAIAAPIGASAASVAAAGGGFNGSVHVAPAPVQVAVLNSPAHVRSFLTSADGRKVLYDTVRSQMLELGLKS